MHVQFLDDGDRAEVIDEGTAHQYSVDGSTADVGNYDYEGPEDSEPDAVREAFQEHVDEYLQDDAGDDVQEAANLERDRVERVSGTGNDEMAIASGQPETDVDDGEE